MAIVVESVGSLTTGSASGTTIDVSAPSGVQVGNTLVAHLAKGGSDGSITFDTPSGWTLLQQTNQNSMIVSAVFYKVADSSDALASTFQFTFSTSTQLRFGRILRLSGADVTGIQSSIAGANNSSTVNATTITPVAASSIIMFFVAANPEGVARTCDSYTLGADPPSFTEHYDDSTGSSVLIAAASGIRPETTATGDFAATLSGSDPNIGIGVVIQQAIINVSINPSVLTVAVSTPAPSVSGSAVATVSTLEVTTSIPTPTITVQDAKWTNPDKTSSTWTNPTKS